MKTEKPILEIKNLSIDYPIHIGTVRAVEDLSLELFNGEALGLVGESGCGKSTLGLSLLRLLRAPGRISHGEIRYHGRDIVTMSEEEVRQVRGKNIAMVFQNPLTSLNPLERLDHHFIETQRVHYPALPKEEYLRRAAEVLEALGVDPQRLGEYPHQLSGGMRQRVMIGLGLVLNPDILIADEPTTSLDVIVEAGFVDLLKKLKKDFKLTILLITHNLGLVAEMADRIAVMYGGKIVEVGSVDEVFHQPRHPYTQGLISCVPNIDLDQEQLVTMPGSPPDLVMPPPGCRFEPRCPEARRICRDRLPELRDHGGGRRVACWLHEPEGRLSPKMEAAAASSPQAEGGAQ